MNKGLAAFSNQLGRRLGYAVTAGSTFSTSATTAENDNLVTDDGTKLVTDDGTEIIYAQ